MSGHIERARKHFHQMPDQVFDLWLAEIIVERGWPFATLNEETIGTAFGPLFMNAPLSYWAQLEWSMETIPYDEVSLDIEAYKKAGGIISEVCYGVPIFARPIENMEQRFRACADFISTNKRFPKPVVCYAYSNNTFGMIDGHHRLAALERLEDNEEFPFWAWIGRHPLSHHFEK